MVQEDTMNELDEQAWERWVAFRKVIRKPIKPISEHAAKLKLARFGDDQAAVVDQSIANGWQGLFEIKKAAPRPGEKVEKTDKQRAADVARHAEQDEWAAKAWGKQEPTPLHRLKLCDAYLARLTMREADKDAWDRLRDAAAAAIRDADPKDVLNDPHLVGMVRQLFGERGLERLRNR
jgi:hypothetical protein